jgi:hypothetical protein
VCDSNGLCETGCGSIGIGDSDPVFVCLSGDTDGDGLADYLDPDIDGDGIANDDDLDADGDGQDDPVYNNNGDGNAFDTSNIEGLLSTANTIADDARNGIGAVNSGLGTLNQTASQIKDSLSGEGYSGKTADDLSAGDTLIDDAFTGLNETLSKTESELGGRTVTETDFQFIDTFIGQLPAANCEDPVFHKQTLDWCSKAPTINSWLYWIVAALTVAAVFHELNETLRRK